MKELTPGIYHDISHADYLSLPYISNSYLGRIADCPAAAKVPVEDTPSMMIGRATHCFILEPETFGSRYAVAPAGDRRKKEGKEVYEAFIATANGREIITQDDMTTLEGIRNSILAHPSASGLINKGQAEVTIIWDDQVTGLRCKARIDWTPALVERTLIDLKTTKDADAYAFSKSCVKYGYARQAAFYLDGMKTLRRDYDLFGFVAVESEPPHRTETYTLSQEFIDYGRKQYRDLMIVELACIESGQWPAYKNSMVTELELPGYLKTSQTTFYR